MTAKEYIREIVEYSCLPKTERKRIEADLQNEIDSAIQRGESIEQIIQRMGNPDEVATELYESFIGRVSPRRPFWEYKSKIRLFGLPIIHIVGAPRLTSGDGNSYLLIPTARGILAIGMKAKGIIAIGNFSSGILAIGNIAVGAITIGTIGVGLVSVSNVSVGILSIGTLALGYLSAGVLSAGYGTFGVISAGRFAVAQEVTGHTTLSIPKNANTLEYLTPFLADLEAPAIIQNFYHTIENILKMSSSTGILLLTTFLISLFVLIFALIFVSKKILKRS